MSSFRILAIKLRTMNKLRLIRYFALLIAFCAGYRCAPRETWHLKLRALIDEASNAEPRELMKGNIQDVLFENDGVIVKSYSDKSLTLIVNEHTVERESENSDATWLETRVFYHVIIRLTDSNSRSESIFTFWSMQITSFLYFACTSGKIKFMLMPEVNQGIITVDLLHPGDAELIWYYAWKNRRRRRIRVADVLRFQIFNRRTKEKVEEFPFAVVHKEWSKNTSTTYTISLESHGVTRKALLIFSSGRYSVSKIIEDRIGLFISDEPDMVFILQFSPFENEAAVAFHAEISLRRCITMYPISDNELRAFIN